MSRAAAAIAFVTLVGFPLAVLILMGGDDNG